MRSAWPPLAFLFAVNQPLSVASRAAAGFPPFPRQTSGTLGVGIQVGLGNCRGWECAAPAQAACELWAGEIWLLFPES